MVRAFSSTRCARDKAEHHLKVMGLPPPSKKLQPTNIYDVRVIWLIVGVECA